jgi:hypothetical protein
VTQHVIEKKLSIIQGFFSFSHDETQKLILEFKSAPPKRKNWTPPQGEIQFLSLTQ